MCKRCSTHIDLRDYQITNAVSKNFKTKGQFVIEIPKTWRVTFGYVNPAVRESGYRDGHCLRVYEGEKLRAVYANVQSFRDLSIPLARKVSKETGSAEWTMDSAGNFEERRKVEVQAELVEGDLF